MIRRSLIIVALALLTGFLSLQAGFSPDQAIVAAIFALSILGVLFFWELRLCFVFFGAGLVLITHAVDLESLIHFASLDVILFLIGMMIMVGMLNDVGFFYWIVTRLIRVKNITGELLFILLMVISGILSGLMGEVASIIIMVKVILDICDLLDADPVPLILSSVIATNIGSAGTVLGNPIGILIAARGHLTFEDFITQALPVTIVVFVITVAFLSWWFRKYIRSLNTQLIPLRDNAFFIALITMATDRKTKISIALFALMLVSIMVHRRLELFFGLAENTFLMILPILFAGIAMLYRRDRIRHYVEREVEWMSILFFMFLFALAGVMKSSGIAEIIAANLAAAFGATYGALVGMMVFSSGFLSSILDNTVVVASYIPVVQEMGDLGIAIRPLWWALLFGACFGGNVTVIGSTANIVAMDVLERKRHIRISFLAWLKIGFVVGVIAMTVSFILLVTVFMKGGVQ